MKQGINIEQPTSTAFPKTKWGSAVTSGRNGYQTLPDALLRNQWRLKLTCTDIVVLANILMHWWENEPHKMPHPRPEQIAKRIGTSSRTVQRCIGRLCDAGLLKWMPPEKGQEGISVRRFDVSGLVQTLRQFAKEVEGPEEQAV